MRASLARHLALLLMAVALVGAAIDPRSASASEPNSHWVHGSGGRVEANGVSSTPAWTYESDIANAFIGYSASVAGDVNGDGYDDVIGYGTTSGARLVLLFGGPNGPTLAPGFPVTIPADAGNVNAAGDVNGDGFADVIVGWPGATFGTIRVYHGGPSGLNMAAPFSYFQNFTNGFGQFVGTAGDVNGDGYDEVIVGSPNAPGGGTLCSGSPSNTGEVDVFYGSATGLSTNRWVMLGCRYVPSGGFMGMAAATAGDVNADGYDDIVMGAPGATLLGGGTTPYGSAWVVYGSASGLPLTPGFSNLGTLSGATRLDSPTAFATFGTAAITAGDVNGDGYADVAVGSPYDDTFASDGGFIRIYAGGPGGASTTQMWWESSSLANTRLGERIVPAGDVNGDRRGDLFVGSNGTLIVAPSTGSGLVFSKFIAGTHGFGTAGDVNGDGLSDVLVADAFYSNGQTNEGRIAVYKGVGETAHIRTWSYIQGVESNPNLGWSVASAGDVNGDGLDDVLVGSPTKDNGTSDNGSVMLFLGAPGALSPSPAMVAFGNAGDQLGVCVAQAGDLNGDGYCDVVAGAHQPGIGASGKVLVWYGGPIPPSGGPPNVVLNGTSGVDSYFGSAISGGDFNGDGIGDLAVGAPYADNVSHGFPYADAGRVYVYFGSLAGLNPVPAYVFSQFQDGAHFGASLTGWADTDGDGYTELLVGVPDWDAFVDPFTLQDAGGVFEYGRFETNPLAFRRVVRAGVSFDRFGASVAHAGDIDGDGYGDVIAGAPNAVNTLQGEGGAWVFRGGSSGLSTSPWWAQPGGEGYGSFGSFVSSAGDVNGDGLSDVMVGAVFQDAGGAQDRGTARVYLGPLTGAPAPAWTGYGAGTFANLGHCLANAGDVDGDGWNDFVFGEPGFSSSVYREGLIDVYTATYGLGLPAVTRATRALGAIAPLGLTDVGAMGFAHTARSAAGRTDVKLAWKLTSTLIGVPAPTIEGMQTSFTPTGDVLGSGSQANLSASVSGMKSGFPYAWQVRTRARSVYFPTTKMTGWALNGSREWDVRVPGSLAAPTANDEIPELMLSAPMPNPSRSGSMVRFALPRAAKVQLTIYDAQGRRVRELVNGTLPEGAHEARWDGTQENGRRAETGVYFYRFESDGSTSSRRFVLIH